MDRNLRSEKQKRMGEWGSKNWKGKGFLTERRQAK